MSEIPGLLSPVLCYMSHCSHNRPQLRLGPSPANTAHLLIATPNMSAKTSLASSLLLTNLATSLASVAIGLGRLDPGRSIFSSLSVLTVPPQWTLTPAWTQTLASPTPWDVPGASRPPVARPSVTSVTGPSSSPTPSKAQSSPSSSVTSHFQLWSGLCWRGLLPQARSEHALPLLLSQVLLSIQQDQRHLLQQCGGRLLLPGGGAPDGG